MNPTRRDFVRTGAALAAATLPLSASERGPGGEVSATADSVIFLMLTGGPSQLDTWDPKPDAPSGVRGPFAPIRTRVPGVQVSELFPKLAGILDKVALVRSVYHDGPAIHEAGFQLVNSGRLTGSGPAWPNLGAALAEARPLKDYNPFDWMLSGERVDCGLPIDLGQSEGWLTGHSPNCNHWDEDYIPSMHEHFFTAVESVAYWKSRVAVVNQFDTVFDAPTWDCHAAGGNLNTTIADVRDVVAPSFDAAFTNLIRYLDETGRLERTLVVATGEFGRTPKLNSGGGRDHWPGCWTTLFAGGGRRVGK